MASIKPRKSLAEKRAERAQRIAYTPPEQKLGELRETIDQVRVMADGTAKRVYQNWEANGRRYLETTRRLDALEERIAKLENGWKGQLDELARRVAETLTRFTDRLVKVEGAMPTLDNRINALSADIKGSLRDCVKVEDFTQLWHHEWVSEIGKGAVPFPEPHEDKPQRELFIIVHGTIGQSTSYIGPFFSAADAADYADRNIRSDDYSIIKLEPQEG